MNPSADGADHFNSDNDDASDAVRHGRAGKLSVEPFVNEETVAIRLNRNTALLEAFAERSVREGATVPLPGDRARDTKLDTVPEKE